MYDCTPSERFIKAAQAVGITGVSFWYRREPITGLEDSWFCKCEVGLTWWPAGTPIPTSRPSPLPVQELNLLNRVVGRVAQCPRCHEAYWETLKWHGNIPDPERVSVAQPSGIWGESLDVTAQLREALEGGGEIPKGYLRGLPRAEDGTVSIELNAQGYVGFYRVV